MKKCCDWISEKKNIHRSTSQGSQVNPIQKRLLQPVCALSTVKLLLKRGDNFFPHSQTLSFHTSFVFRKCVRSATCGVLCWLQTVTVKLSLATFIHLPQFKTNCKLVNFYCLLVTWWTNKFNIQQLYALPTLYLCVLYLSENKQWLAPLTSYTDWFI